MSIVPRISLAGFTVNHDPGVPSGGNMGYIGSVEGVAVHSTPLLSGRGILCSSHLLRHIAYGNVRDDGSITDFSLIEGANLTECDFLFRFAQLLEWSDEEIIEFLFA